MLKILLKIDDQTKFVFVFQDSAASVLIAKTFSQCSASTVTRVHWPATTSARGPRKSALSARLNHGGTRDHYRPKKLTIANLSSTNICLVVYDYFKMQSIAVDCTKVYIKHSFSLTQ